MTVYFARAVGADRIKIGYVQATGDAAPSVVARRMQQLGWLFGVPVELIVTVEGKRRLERWFHRRHATAAIGREWFHLTAPLAADIETLRANGTLSDQPLPFEENHTRFYRAWHVATAFDGKRYWTDHVGFRSSKWAKHLLRLRANQEARA